MADDASWDARRGRSRASSASSPSSSTSSPSTSGRRAAASASSHRSSMEGKFEARRDHRRPPKGLAKKWGALSRLRQWAEQDPSLQRLQLLLVRLLERAKPVLNRMRSRSDSLVERFWPPVKRWAVFGGRLLLMLLFATLECSIRGFQSIFRLSSAALCLTLCCCILSLTVLAGFVSITIAIVFTAAATFFLGLIPGLAVLGLYGAVVLWIYGSFWATSAVLLIAGSLFCIEQSRVAGGAVVLIYSIYSCKVHGGWLGLTLCFGLSFVSSDLVIFFLTSIEERRQSEKQQHDRSNAGFKPHQAQTGHTEDENGPSVSGAPDIDQTVSEEEVARVLGCSDHYAVLGFARFQQCDETLMKKEYRKKAMLVHPDKNKGNVRAEEAFKRLQNAYEVLLDTAKKKCYDDDLRREQLIMNFRRNGFGFHQNGRCESPDCACHNHQHQDEGEAELIDARPIVCRNCKQLHMWTLTDRNKQHARWCQDCQEFHSAKEGDGWVEQFTQSFFFGLFQKVDLPQAYACAGSVVYNVTDWAICQGMKCPANTHKPSFYVSTGAVSQGGSSRHSTKSKKGGNVADGFPFPDIDENMSEQEFYEWLEKAMASGVFDMNSTNAQPHHQQQQQQQQNHQQQNQQPNQQPQQQQQQASSSSNHNKHSRKKKKGGNNKKQQW